jgi:hypothetical protein
VFPDVVKLAEINKTEKKATDEVDQASTMYRKATGSKQVGRKGVPSFFGL